MTKVREFSNDRATMSVETVENKYHVVHLTAGCSKDLMKEVFAEYRGKHLFACVTIDSPVNKVAKLFGDLVRTRGRVNIYHIKGE